MRILYLTDRLSKRGGADHHLQDVIRAAAARWPVTVASGGGAATLAGAAQVRVKGLGSPVERSSGLERLEGLLAAADVVHIQNVMNPEALRRAVATGRAVVTVQDHRVFCPGPGKALPSGAACAAPMGEGVCAGCFAEAGYGRRALALTRARLAALRGARVVVLSGYMAGELAAVGLPGAAVIPPWVEAGGPAAAGEGFLLAGRLVAHKAPGDALAAWRLAGSPQGLSVAGAGPLAGALEGAAHLGWLDRAALRRALRGARALLFPTRWQEPFGIAGLEALAEGTPVIAMASGGMGDWAGEGCLLVQRGDVAGMAQAIRRLAEDPGAARALGEAGLARVGRFSRASLWPRLEAIYCSIAG